MSVRLLEPTQAELDEAMAWYAQQAPGLGDAFLIETLVGDCTPAPKTRLLARQTMNQRLIQIFVLC